MPSRQLVAKELGEVFKVLAHPDRIRLIEELRSGEKDVNTLAAARRGAGPAQPARVATSRSVAAASHGRGAARGASPFLPSRPAAIRWLDYRGTQLHRGTDDRHQRVGYQFRSQAVVRLFGQIVN